VLAREDYWDRVMLHGVKRPPTARILGPEARRQYRREYFGLDE
jgi:hypothetical protein